jgi:glutaredoxin
MLKRKHNKMNAPETIDQLLKDHRVTIFSKSYCPFCVKVSDHLYNFMNIFSPICVLKGFPSFVKTKVFSSILFLGWGVRLSPKMGQCRIVSSPNE